MNTDLVPQSLDEKARRVYWTQQMDEAYAFMQAIRSYPVNECGEKCICMRDVAASEEIEVSFAEGPQVNGLPRLFYLREGLIGAFIAAAWEMNEYGWIMRIEDAFRTREMQRGNTLSERVFDVVLRKCVWECGDRIPSADLLFRRLSALIANCPKVGTHMSGTAMDISVLDRDTGGEIDRGGPYLELSELTPMHSPFVSAAAHVNRRAIGDLMARHGFLAYPWEFWHYNQGDAYAEYLQQTGNTARYGAVNLDEEDGAVDPIRRPTRLLNTRETIERALRAAIERQPTTCIARRKLRGGER
ncbi:MAG: hypothetical protein AUJ92_18505 [Armatimonadetes bacterium CG2_30_59_28]|nr:M15 family metallopeptidase [Armatimonadota bacterium]OIO90564.1 MAG: hypothetical protein AUJ92_18505 [Armatimonadetes bacterium CG2_30_59_28]PIU65384.1 MAG: hypothetical protein COS85_08950 [Armatimonadetes bacterium CG07_land_8_20_14_0_80_59_28]PIY48381.1 MAG: hypothetical protein COZ05_03250 [Armatimonadetes bacterium CG_4_10_14_3_um_filter_59_10]